MYIGMTEKIYSSRRTQSYSTSNNSTAFITNDVDTTDNKLENMIVSIDKTNVDVIVDEKNDQIIDDKKPDVNARKRKRSILLEKWNKEDVPNWQKKSKIFLDRYKREKSSNLSYRNGFLYDMLSGREQPETIRLRSELSELSENSGKCLLRLNKVDEIPEITKNKVNSSLMKTTHRHALANNLSNDEVFYGLAERNIRNEALEESLQGSCVRRVEATSFRRRLLQSSLVAKKSDEPLDLTYSNDSLYIKSGLFDNLCGKKCSNMRCRSVNFNSSTSNKVLCSSTVSNRQRKTDKLKRRAGQYLDKVLKPDLILEAKSSSTQTSAVSEHWEIWCAFIAYLSKFQMLLNMNINEAMNIEGKRFNELVTLNTDSDSDNSNSHIRHTTSTNGEGTSKLLETNTEHSLSEHNVYRSAIKSIVDSLQIGLIEQSRNIPKTVQQDGCDTINEQTIGIKCSSKIIANDTYPPMAGIPKDISSSQHFKQTSSFPGKQKARYERDKLLSNSQANHYSKADREITSSKKQHKRMNILYDYQSLKFNPDIHTNNEIKLNASLGLTSPITTDVANHRIGSAKEKVFEWIAKLRLLVQSPHRMIIPDMVDMKARQLHQLFDSSRLELEKYSYAVRVLLLKSNWHRLVAVFAVEDRLGVLQLITSIESNDMSNKIGSKSNSINADMLRQTIQELVNLHNLCEKIEMNAAAFAVARMGLLLPRTDRILEEMERVIMSNQPESIPDAELNVLRTQSSVLDTTLQLDNLRKAFNLICNLNENAIKYLFFNSLGISVDDFFEEIKP